ncbi:MULTISPECIES: TauD/TfdA family dioxygenase [Pseudoalteromonas]|uniref:TauD/TfdA family dioxygenase n=1 Tax=Pseudoalteromonas obscura TaxID=3048491 RepID=A0ABT7EH55_9GAMM|nr:MULTISPECIES: TauD/TfdA family dioxygenase [Pseudoalteromonas]MDK2594353.1 TauD/TfdA family dioxygenase [Pseudoalteromonas sp. P94(2023)]
MGLMSINDLVEVEGQPLVLNVDLQGEKTLDWAQRNRAELESLVATNGAVLIKGLKVVSTGQFSKLLQTIFQGPLLEYQYRSTPRTGLKGNIYTATEYHASETILQHNENAYSNEWPLRLGFLCMQPSPVGGETPIADSCKLYELIPQEIRDKFESKQLKYVRNYSDVDLPWQEVFQTSDKGEVEAFCRQKNINFEWLPGDRLRTWQINPASIVHPVSGKKVWFNQAHLFHVSSLGKDMKESLINSLGKEFLPRNVYFGDGSEIDESELQLIRDLNQDLRIKFKWEKHNLMLIDNTRFSHGREPYEGNRKILVGMSAPSGFQSI